VFSGRDRAGWQRRRGELWLAMQNDNELSFRIYSAGAAQKPNRPELEAEATCVELDWLGAFDTLEDEIAGARVVGGVGDLAPFELFVY
jgi:hypothetical protein